MKKYLPLVLLLLGACAAQPRYDLVLRPDEKGSLLLRVDDSSQEGKIWSGTYLLRRADLYRSGASGASDWEAFYGRNPPEGTPGYQVLKSPFLLLSRGGAWYVGRAANGLVQKDGGTCELKEIRSGDGGAPLSDYSCPNGAPDLIVPVGGFTRVRSFRFLAPGDDYTKAFSK